MQVRITHFQNHDDKNVYVADADDIRRLTTKILEDLGRSGYIGLLVDDQADDYLFETLFEAFNAEYRNHN